MSESHLEVARALVAAVEVGDIDAVSALYTDDVAVWHNHDNKTQTKAESLAMMTGFVNNIHNRKYIDIRVQATESGFVQQHTLTGSLASGSVMSIPCCLIVTVVDGRISRLDEYLDPAAIPRR